MLSAKWLVRDAERGVVGRLLLPSEEHLGISWTEKPTFYCLRILDNLAVRKVTKHFCQP